MMHKLRVSYRHRYGVATRSLDAVELSSLLGISRKTAERYIRDPTRCPRIALELLQIKAFGIMPDKEFDGFFARNGQIFTPAGRGYNPGQLETIAWMHDRDNAIDRDNARLKKTIEILENAVEHWRVKAGENPAANDSVG